MSTASRAPAEATSYPYLDPGPLADDALQLVAPSARWLDALMSALQHPLTKRDMPKLAETTRKQVQEFIARTANGFEPGNLDAGLAPAYQFWMKTLRPRAGEPAVVGGIGLRLGHSFNLDYVIGHIGYHVYPFARGHRYAERACRLLLPLARRHGVTPLWITCNPDNWASRRTCERLGAELVDVVPVPRDHPLFSRGETSKCRYRIEL